MDDLYAERAYVIAALVRSALDAGWVVGVCTDPDAPDWPVVLIDLPTGQVSWHINVRDTHAFPPLPQYPGEWDGHTTEEKYARVIEYARANPKREPRNDFIYVVTGDWTYQTHYAGHDSVAAHTEVREITRAGIGAEPCTIEIWAKGERISVSYVDADPGEVNG